MSADDADSDVNIMQHVMELEELGNRLFTDISEDHKDHCFGVPYVVYLKVEIRFGITRISVRVKLKKE